MEKICKTLKKELFSAIAAILLVIVLFETDAMPVGVLTSSNWLFLVTAVMELLTVCVVPLALYLFRIPRIHDGLTTSKTDAQQHLLFWGTVRMAMICIPLFFNVLLYYLSGLVVSFFYMAVILALCLFMIYPSLRRCQLETEPQQ